MPTTFRPCELDQRLLLAPDVREWLPERNFAHHVGDLADGLDLAAFYAPYESGMMVKVLLYGMRREGSRRGRWHYALPVSRLSCPSPHRVRPVYPPTFLSYLSTAQIPGSDSESQSRHLGGKP